jgi:hypothetical protein
MFWLRRPVEIEPPGRGTASPKAGTGRPNGKTPANHLPDAEARRDSDLVAHPDQQELTAVDAHSRLAQLRNERSLALHTGVAKIGPYIADLDEEIEVWSRLYTAAAVTEIATLRAELSGALNG